MGEFLNLTDGGSRFVGVLIRSAALHFRLVRISHRDVASANRFLLNKWRMSVCDAAKRDEMLSATVLRLFTFDAPYPMSPIFRFCFDYSTGMSTRPSTSRPRRDTRPKCPRPRRDRDIENFGRDETETRRRVFRDETRPRRSDFPRPSRRWSRSTMARRQFGRGLEG
jgi:hypothetical protein